MTMLYSLFSREGLVWAADSRITRPGSKRAEPSQRKVLRVSRVGVTDGLIGYYGLAEAGRRPMSSWLASFISAWPGSRAPEDFAVAVASGLQAVTTPAERRAVSGLHLGAFRRTIDRRVEPVFFHIRNTYDYDLSTGRHINVGPFWQEEQLMGRDVAALRWDPRHVRTHLGAYQREQGLPFWYRNGDIMLFGALTTALQSALMQIGRLSNYSSPTTLGAWERVARTMVITTAQIARAYNRGRIPTIGDQARVLSVPWPA